MRKGLEPRSCRAVSAVEPCGNERERRAESPTATCGGCVRKSGKNMKKLQEQNIIRRVGADKNGYWEIVEA